MAVRNPGSAPPLPTGLEWAHSIVRDWFIGRFGTPTEPQLLGWPSILSGQNTLISAPTGSGKTLAAMLACIDALVRHAAAGTLDDRTHVVYVSPLKALGNDIQQNLDGPLAEIAALAEARGVSLAGIRTAVRTGDTTASARRTMLRRPPHILVTTPESLFILLTADKSREILRDVGTLIVDEIHAMVDDKRGAHLAISIERLAALSSRPVTRIGLSATQKPIEAVAAFLGGGDNRIPHIVEVAPRRTLDLAVEVPSLELGPVASHEMWDDIYDRIAALVGVHRSTLVFVNTRRLAERVAHHLAERLGADAVGTHHGSLARKTRLDAERRLKHGDLRVLVATASLELGIDVGTVDLVCQVGSPRSIAVAVQRVGRSGHWRGAVPKGRLFATTLDDLTECAAIVLAIRRGELDRLVIPKAPLDILSQQIVAMCAVEEWDEDALFACVTGAFPYRDLRRAEFDEILEMLSNGIAARRGRYAAYLHRDRVNGRVTGRRGARLAAITSGGAIPDTGLYTVVSHPEGTVVGTVDEDFAVESLAGDIMLLGNTSWRIRRVTSAGRVIVEDARGAAPNIPFWRGEAPARTAELSAHVSVVRSTVDRLTSGAERPVAAPGVSALTAATDWLRDDCGLNEPGAEQLVRYITSARAALGVVPCADTIVAERFFDEGGGMQLVIHAPFGARINKAWGLALRKRFCRSFNFELQAAATDNGINISLAEQHSFPLADVFGFLRPATARDVLEQAALASPIFATRWRWDASRALALLRFRNGRKTPIQILRMQSDDLLASVFPDVAACQENIEGDIQIPDHPLVREVMKDVLTEAMDLDGFLDVLVRLGDGRLRAVAVDTPAPSVFSHEILNANPYAFLDDAPLEERRARAVQMRRSLPEAVLSEIGQLDPAAVREVSDQAWPDVRHANDLHDALLTLIAFPERDAGERFANGLTSDLAGESRAILDRVSRASADWLPWFAELRATRRATTATVDARSYWVATERRAVVATLFPSAIFADEPPLMPDVVAPAIDPAVAVVQGWLGHSGPTTVGELAQVIGMSIDGVEGSLLGLEATGWALRGRFLPRLADSRVPGQDSSPLRRSGGLASAIDSDWCERRLLARIHRLTIGTLRREIAPVSPAIFMAWLLRWQHVAPGTRVAPDTGTIEVLRQLQGFEAPANAWERQILAARIQQYDPAELDRLCLVGEVGWGRLSPHPGIVDASSRPGRRISPTSVAPITFFVREDADWLQARDAVDVDATPAGLSAPARGVLDVLGRQGASFFPEIARGAARLKSEVESALWELVTAGLVTADGFDSLRALIDPRRRAGHGSGRTARPRHSTGRWSLLRATSGETGLDRGRIAESAAWMLLRRYGIVFRELLSRESNLPPWRDLLTAFRRLEDRGEIRGGRFVDGFIGEQFAQPIALESLRAARQAPAADDIVIVSAADPLNLAGILVPGDRVPALSGKSVRFRNGIALGAADADGSEWRIASFVAAEHS